MANALLSSFLPAALRTAPSLSAFPLRPLPRLAPTFRTAVTRHRMPRAEIPLRILSANTPGFAVVAAGPVVLCREVALSVELTDLDCCGSWEGSLPESSSLGGDCTPLRGAFIDSDFPPGFKNSLRRPTLSTLSDYRYHLAAVISRRPGRFWSAAMAHSFAAANSRHKTKGDEQRVRESKAHVCPMS